MGTKFEVDGINLLGRVRHCTTPKMAKNAQKKKIHSKMADFLLIVG